MDRFIANPNFSELIDTMNTFMKSLEDGINSILGFDISCKKRVSNNWKKIHGLPMKRRYKRKEK